MGYRGLDRARRGQGVLDCDGHGCRVSAHSGAGRLMCLIDAKWLVESDSEMC